MSAMKIATLLLLVLATPAFAQSLPDTFKDGPGYAKIHVASGFVCPASIGPFERDAAGENDVQTGSDLCSYAALDGVYGTIVLTPLAGLTIRRRRWPPNSSCRKKPAASRSPRRR